MRIIIHKCTLLATQNFKLQSIVIAYRYIFVAGLTAAIIMLFFMMYMYAKIKMYSFDTYNDIRDFSRLQKRQDNKTRK